MKEEDGRIRNRRMGIRRRSKMMEEDDGGR